MSPMDQKHKKKHQEIGVENDQTFQKFHKMPKIGDEELALAFESSVVPDVVLVLVFGDAQ